MSKKIIPFWVQYFITCSLFVVLSIFIISIAFVNKYIENENEMINGKLDIVGQFFETNFSSYISNC